MTRSERRFRPENSLWPRCWKRTRELETEVQDAKSEIVRLGEVRDNLDIELAAALLKISEAETRADSNLEAAARLESELDEERKKVSAGELALAAMLEANKGLETEVQDAKSEIVRLGEVRDSLDVRLAAALLKISEAETRADSNLEAAARLESELDEERKKVSAGELALAAMLEANKELETEVQDAKSEIVRLGEVRDNLDVRLAAALLKISEAETRADSNLEAAARLEAERNALADRLAAAEAERDADASRFIVELNMQAAELNEQIRALQASLDLAISKEEDALVEIRSLGNKLNSALARAAAEGARRLKAEEERNELLEKEAQQLERFQSAFLSGLRDKIEGRDGVRIEGDRFVFSSEVLFESNDATLSEKGKAEISNVAGLLTEIAEDFPQDIDWILRVDGHTDVDPIRDGGLFKDNWELSQGRSLSVVRYLIDEFDFEPKRLAATGFGEHRPIAPGDSEEAKSRNRRIELKLTGS